MHLVRSTRWLSLVLAASVAACGGGGDDGPTPPVNVGGFAVSLSSTSLSVVAGASGTITANIARTGSFSGTVDLSTEGVPTGITASFAPAQVTSGTTATTLTVVAAATVTPGNHTFTVRGKANGLTDQTASVTVTVTAPPPTGAIALSLAPAAGTAQQGGNTTFTVNIARTSFTGGVTLAVSGAPAGVTPTVATSPVAGNSATVQLAVGAAVTPGNHTITITGSATGVANASASYTLTVTAAPPPAAIALSVTPASASVQQGGSTTFTTNIARTSFTGDVTLAVSGLPTGVTAAVNTSPTAGNSATVQLSVGAGATVGTHTVTVTGSGTGIANATASFALTVTAAPVGSGNVSYSFGFCAATDRPIWVAAQNGTGPWQQVVGSNNGYAFNVGTSGGIAYVTQNAANDFDILFYFGTLAELQAHSASICPTTAAKTVHGSVAGVSGTGRTAFVTLGASSTTVTAPATTFTLNNVLSGTVDLLAARTALNFQTGSLTTDRLIVRRALTPADGSTLPVLDFAGSEAFAPDTKALTVNGAAGGETVSAATTYTTANRASGLISMGILSGSTGTYAAMPAAKQATGDLHLLLATATQASGSSTASRMVARVFKDAVAQTLTLGAALNTPTFTSLATAPYARTRVQLALQSEYNRFWALGYSQASGGTVRSVTVVTTQAYTGGGAFDFAFPDFTGVAGWQNVWGPLTGVSATFVVSASGWTTGGTVADPYVEGTTVLSAARTGTFTP